MLVDGGSSWTALWRVIVPLSLPGIVATAVYTFLLSWNEFLFALTLTKSMDMRTVPIGIALLMGQHAFEWNEMMAMSVLGSLPLLLLYLIAQRYFLAGHDRRLGEGLSGSHPVPRRKSGWRGESGRRTPQEC